MNYVVDGWYVTEFYEACFIPEFRLDFVVDTKWCLVYDDPAQYTRAALERDSWQDMIDFALESEGAEFYA